MNYKHLNRIETGARINRMIDKSGISREDLAAKLGFCSSRVIYSWENGEKLPSLEHFYVLAQALNVKVDDLLAS